LVVITIVGVLVAMLLPSLGKAREVGRRVACMSNMRQITIACFNFAADQNDQGPVHRVMQWNFWGAQGYIAYFSEGSAAITAGQRNWFIWPGGGALGRMYPNLLMDGGYIGSIPSVKTSGTVFDCPSYGGATTRDLAAYPPRSNLSYGMNEYTLYRHNGLISAVDPNTIPEYNKLPFKQPTVKFQSVGSPSQAYYMVDRVQVLDNPTFSAHWSDSSAISFDNLGNPGFDWFNEESLSAYARWATWFHDTGVNLACMDGSAHFVSRAEALQIHNTETPYYFRLKPGYGFPYAGPCW
jgi:hypothetical protein